MRGSTTHFHSGWLLGYYPAPDRLTCVDLDPVGGI